MAGADVKLSSFTRSEISDLFKRARVAVRYSGIRILAATASLPYARVLMVTPRASGNAPERNLFRRRIKAIFKENNLTIQKKDIIVIVDKRAIALTFEKLKQLLFLAVGYSHDS